MEYYILINNIKQGPFSKEVLIQKEINGETLVWCNGMTEWKKAREIPDLADILSQLPPEPPHNNHIMPKTWLVESILVTIFCCLPLGIVGIVNASKVEEYFIKGEYQMAEYYSNLAKKWSLWGLLSCVIMVVAYFLFLIVAGLSLIPFL